ncbi:STAS domain-containing protein [Citreimonas salinaria]|uniref:STAS domain-containing protein n=1 Tax=Citreimonas salinaria TaxID=321339 RepID=A0A1H3JG70_9RHOB|nr:STAS domain-containing protein [Citreimonas salinaria]SDY38902.1 STAS domain-containing protein [Citreimonas salinaria]
MADIHFHALAPARARSGEDPLVPFLLGARNAPVTISARDVQRLDSLRLQLLLVAKQQWEADGIDFRITDTAPSFHEGLQRLGLNPQHFEKETVQ